MRDLGYDFYRYDTYCKNLFANFFDYSDLAPGQKFEVLTAFEVFEHLNDPMKEIEKMLSFSDNIIFSTELQPNYPVTPENWWYIVPETGQHISLYSYESLLKIAETFGLKVYSYNSFHFLSKGKKMNFKEIFEESRSARAFRKVKSLLLGNNEEEKSLLQKDFYYIKSILYK